METETAMVDDDAGREDDFAKFSPGEEEDPSRAVRAARRVGAFFTHEWTLAALASLVLAAVMTWPTLRCPSYQIPQDIWDPTLEAWMISWGGHAMITDPSNLWNANAFFPNTYSYAFTDTLLGYFPLGMIGSGFTAALI